MTPTTFNTLSPVVALLAFVLSGCEAPVSSATNASGNVSEPAPERAPAKTEDGRYFVSSKIMWGKYESGAVFCYDPIESENSCRSIEYSEMVSSASAVLISFIKWSSFEKQIFRIKAHPEGEFICSTLDDWSISRAMTFVTVDATGKIQSTDVSSSPESVSRWRDDLRQRWSGVIDQKFCYRYALQRDKNGKSKPGTFEEFKYSNGLLQPQEKPVHVVTYDRKDLPNLVLRPQN